MNEVFEKPWEYVAKNFGMAPNSDYKGVGYALTIILVIMLVITIMSLVGYKQSYIDLSAFEKASGGMANTVITALTVILGIMYAYGVIGTQTNLLDTVGSNEPY